MKRNSGPRRIKSNKKERPKKKKTLGSQTRRKNIREQLKRRIDPIPREFRLNRKGGAR